MRLTTWNVNGLRAALRKGLPAHLVRLAPDVLLLQEIRCTPADLPKDWQAPAGWHCVWNPAQKPGYAGTAIWSRFPLREVEIGLGGKDVDHEGRLLSATIEAPAGALRVSSIYLPSGSSGDHRQAEKEKWMKSFRPWADAVHAGRKPVFLGGDLNIAITERDIFHAKSNEETSGFLPHERAWMGELVGSGWRDFIRDDFDAVLARKDLGAVVARFGVEGEGLDPSRHGPYSWWSNRGGARAKNRGWRIDYLLGNAAAAKGFDRAFVHRDACFGAGGEVISDHAPVSVDVG